MNRQRLALENPLGQLRNQTWNLTLTEIKGGRFMIPLPKTTPKTNWPFENHEAVKLE